MFILQFFVSTSAEELQDRLRHASINTVENSIKTFKENTKLSEITQVLVIGVKSTMS